MMIVEPRVRASACPIGLAVLGASITLTLISGCPPVTPMNCDDGDACTTDSMDTDGTCVNTPVACGEGESCDPDTGDCVADTDLCEGNTCDDGDACNGAETCDAATGDCVAGTPVDCTAGTTCDPATGTCVADEPAGFTNADGVRGGRLYDKFWNVTGVTAAEPTEDHPFWAMQSTNTRTGADTWRCKECHGWDYKGVDGAYASGSHMTGFAGIFGSALTPQEAFDNIKDDHGYGAAGLGDDDVWDLVRFVLEGGQRDTDEIIGGDGAFLGDAANGDTLYNNGIGGAVACMVCHGADGLTIDFGGGEYIGTLAVGNPWEFQHKVWYGHPGTAMPAAADANATNDDVADVGAHSQTLPEAP